MKYESASGFFNGAAMVKSKGRFFLVNKRVAGKHR
ncbi:MAG: hypothetical protein IPH68_09865 [Chitinophagaceae bacterium]|nr:hypothetical protein [Chitinophagaceae bacterium]